MELSEVLKFVKKHRLAVIATANDNQPEAAVVEFGQTDDFTIIIDTFDSSRKVKNIEKNNKAAIVIGWDDDRTVQLEGMATKLEGKELEIGKQAYFAKNPRAKKWADHPGIFYYGIKPQWIRYSDLRQKPWKVEEFNL